MSHFTDKSGVEAPLLRRSALLDLLREIHATHEVLKAWVGAQTIHSEIGLQKVRKVGGSFLIRFFEVKALSFSPRLA